MIIWLQTVYKVGFQNVVCFYEDALSCICFASWFIHLKNGCMILALSQSKILGDHPLGLQIKVKTKFILSVYIYKF